jgi:hypothetical protein
MIKETVSLRNGSGTLETEKNCFSFSTFILFFQWSFDGYHDRVSEEIMAVFTRIESGFSSFFIFNIVQRRHVGRIPKNVDGSKLFH